MKNKLFSYFQNIKIFKNKEEKLVYILAVLLRLCFLGLVVYLFSNNGLVMMGDSPDYLNIARQFVTSHSFLSYSFSGVFETTRLPGYPFFLSIFIFFHIPFFAVSVIQILLVSFIPIIIMRIGKLGGLTCGVTKVTGLFWAFEPASIVYSVMLLPDASNALIFLLAFLYLIYFIKEKSQKFIYISAILFSLMNYIRPAGLFFGIMLPLCLILYGIFTERQKIKVYLKSGLIFAITFFIVLTPWMVRNYIHYGVFSFASGIERQLYEITAVGVRAAAEHASQGEMLTKMRNEILPVLVEKRDLASFKNNGLMFGPAIHIILSHPAEYLKLYVMSLITFFASGNYHHIGSTFHLFSSSDTSISYTMIYTTSGFWAMIKTLFSTSGSPYGIIIILGRILWSILAFLTLVGIYIERKNKEMLPVIIFFLCVCIYMVIVISHLTVGIEARHRFFIDPFYFLFTSIVLYSIVNKFKKV